MVASMAVSLTAIVMALLSWLLWAAASAMLLHPPDVPIATIACLTNASRPPYPNWRCCWPAESSRLGTWTVPNVCGDGLYWYQFTSLGCVLYMPKTQAYARRWSFRTWFQIPRQRFVAFSRPRLSRPEIGATGEIPGDRRTGR
jgi:hypothetical protein